MKRLFQLRRKKRTNYAVTVLMKRADGSLMDHAVIGPLTRSDAERLAQHFDEAMSKNLGDDLNVVGADVQFASRVIVMNDRDAAVWIANAARRLIETGTPMRIREMQAYRRAELERQSDDLRRQFPWLPDADQDGFIVDSTRWERPSVGGQAFDEWREELRRRVEDEGGDR